MYGWVWDFLSTEGFQPRGYCLLWRPEVFWLHIVADALIALSYFSIPAALIYFAQRRRDLVYRWVLYLFGTFIVSCGITHVFGIWTMWVPDYGVEGLVKAATAIVSLVTAAALWPLMPRLLAIPSREALEATNRELHREVTERRAAEAQLDTAKAELERALHDDLTGLAGRNLLYSIWDAAVARAGRADAGLGVLMIDLDGFKSVNDRFGHTAGDTVLVTVAGRLRNCIRTSDGVARLGGDEFVILLESLPAPEYATTIAETIAEAIRAPIDIGGQWVSVGASVGIATAAPTSGESWEDVLARADAEMYARKSSDRTMPRLVDLKPAGDAGESSLSALAATIAKKHRRRNLRRLLTGFGARGAC